MSALFCVSFVFHVLLFNQQLHPQKLTCPLKRDYFNRKYIFQPLIFRGLSLVFWGEKFSVPNTSPPSCWQLWWHVRALPPRGPCVPGWSSDCRSAIRTSIFSPTQEKAHSTRNLGEFDIYIYITLFIYSIYIIIYTWYTEKLDQISLLKSKPLSWIEFHAKYLDDFGADVTRFITISHFYTHVQIRYDPEGTLRKAAALRSAAAPSLPAIGPSLPGPGRLSSWLPPTL